MSHETARAGRHWTGILCSFAFLITPISPANAQDTAQIELLITGITEITGTMAIAVFDSERSFEARANPVAQALLPVQSESLTWIVELGVPRSYAIIVYQDLNGNGEIDLNPIGIPREPYGFSNNARNAFGPPAFRKARIDLEAGRLLHEIEMR